MTSTPTPGQPEPGETQPGQPPLPEHTGQPLPEQSGQPFPAPDAAGQPFPAPGVPAPGFPGQAAPGPGAPHPAWQPAAPKPPASPRTLKKRISLIGGGAALAVSLLSLSVWPFAGQPTLVPDASAPAHGPESWDLQDRFLTEANTALREHDREAFLAFTTGDATEQLGTWWDNLSQVGWSTAAFGPADIMADLRGSSETGESVTFLLAPALGFAASSPRGSGGTDAGLTLVQGSHYEATLVADEETGLRISEFVPANAPNPWDEGPISVAKGDHVVVFAPEGEAQLATDILPEAERAAVEVLAFAKKLGLEEILTGFTVSATNDAASFERWQFGEAGSTYEMDIAGFAAPTVRPSMERPWLDPMIATGMDKPSTMITSVGPLSADQRYSTLVHEFAHVLHFSHTEVLFSSENHAVVSEGFANYVETSVLNGGSYPAPGTGSGRGSGAEVSGSVRAYLAANGVTEPTEASLRGADAWPAYVAAGSLYGYAERLGMDAVWRLAKSGIMQDSTLSAMLTRLDPEFSLDAWAAWASAG